MNSTRNKRLHLGAALFGVCLGLFLLESALSLPTIANVRTVDIVRLLGAGALLGISLMRVALAFNFLRHHDSKEQAAD
jgi:hypothetical protein